jgi:hypothetical protein
MSSSSKEYGYIAYIDEAGDPGLKRVRPLDENGASEWLVLSAVVIRAKWERDVIGWTQGIISNLGVRQRHDLHYRTLSPTRKISAGEQIAALPIRAFAICSNKKNMRGYHNPRATKIPSQQWYYNFCIRLLLERVTAFCAARTMKDHGEIKPIKIEFSERGGIRYSQTAAYQYYLGQQQKGGQVYLKKREPVMSMLDWDLMAAYPHQERAGLQLADYVASAFYQAIDCGGPGVWDIEPAKTLSSILPKEAGLHRDFGVALFPTPAWRAELTDDQKRIFEFYGYDFARW